ncbi:MAG: MoaD/ThiS family protein [Candidatus Freyarchaeum deiterrae]
MRVFVKYYGVIKEFAGTSTEEYVLPEGSVFIDLMNLIVEKHKRDDLYDKLWDKKEKELKPLVLVVVDGEDPMALGGYDKVVLRENSRVDLTTAIAGG